MRVCQDCDKDISNRGKKSQRCKDCQRVINKEKQRVAYNRTKPLKTCNFCKKGHRDFGHHCSTECREIAAATRQPKGPQNRICQNPECAESFVSTRHRLYCSIMCQKRNANRLRYPQTKTEACPVCDRIFSYEGNKRRYCSRDCRRVQASMQNYAIMGNHRDIAVLMMADVCSGCARIFVDGNKMTQKHIDHDHETGQFRGIICGACNSASGFQPEPRRLRLLADYIESTTPKHAQEWAYTGENR